MRNGRRIFSILFVIFWLSASVAMAAGQYDVDMDIEPGSVIACSDDPPVTFEILSGHADYVTSGDKKGVQILGGEVIVRVTCTAPEYGGAQYLYRYHAVRRLTAEEERMMRKNAPYLLEKAAKAQNPRDPHSYGADYGRNFPDEVLRLVNIERAKAGVRPLRLSTELTRCAKIRAGELPTLYSHTRPNGSKCSTVLKGITHGGYSGENIAAGCDNPADAMDGWMHSDGHRANILNPHYRELGVGYCLAPDSRGIHYWVQIFTS